jgi:hypothetical protein
MRWWPLILGVNSMGRSKHFDNQEYTLAEHSFIKLCKKLKLRVKMDVDDCPVLIPQSQKKAKLYKIGCWGNNIFDLIITAGHGKTKERIIGIVKKLAESQGVVYNTYVEGDAEAILLFDWKYLFVVAKALKLTRKANPGNVANFQKKSAKDKGKV